MAIERLMARHCSRQIQEQAKGKSMARIPEWLDCVARWKEGRDLKVLAIVSSYYIDRRCHCGLFRHHDDSP